MTPKLDMAGYWAEYRRAGHWTGRGLHRLALDAVERHAAMVISDGSTGETVVGILQRADAIASQLRGAGIDGACPMFLVVGHPLGDIAAVLALSLLDAVVFFSPPGLSVEEAARVLQCSGASLLVAECGGAARAAAIAASVGGITVILVNWSTGKVEVKGHERQGHAVALSQASTIAAATRFVTFTSGTTGEPKGIQHSADTLAYAGRWALEYAEPRLGSVVGLVSIAHAAGLAFSLLSALVHGRDLALYRGKWDAERALELIGDQKGAWAMVIPTHLLDLTRALDGRGARLPHFTVSVGGAAVSPALVEAAARVGITACRVFGLSECLGHTSTRGSEPLALRMRSEGKSFPGTEDACVDADRVAHRVGTGEAGCRGPSLFLGYLGEDRPKLSAGGYFLTGDHIEIDEDGRVAVLGRFKDIVIRGGENIDPLEVETHLATAPGVGQAVVLGYADDRLGERVAAAVEVIPGCRPNAELLIAHLASVGLAKFKWPERWLLLDELPRNAVGKIEKKQLRATIQAEDSHAPVHSH